MANLGASALTLGLVVGLAATFAACSSEPSNVLRAGGASGSSSGSTSSSGASSGSIDPTTGEVIPEEERLFREVATDLDKKCGGACHADGTYSPRPPTFLAPPDAYKSVKSTVGIVTKDVYQSALLTKGAHAGPAINVDPDFEKRVIKWLEAESFAIQSQKAPTTAPFTVTQGPNDLDLTSLASAGLTNVHLKFDASLVGAILQLKNIKVSAPAGTDVHILQPRFYRILATPKADGSTDVVDPADSFSNLDQTVPGGQETTLNPGLVLFAGDEWQNFQLGKDQLRLEASKVEPGKVSVLEGPKTCKNVQQFTNNVLPAFRGQGFAPNCQNCHGNGLAGLNLASQDNSLICNQILSKLNQANIQQSLIITKVTAGPHQGGTVNNAQNWTNLFVQNAGAFF